MSLVVADIPTRTEVATPNDLEECHSMQKEEFEVLEVWNCSYH